MTQADSVHSTLPTNTSKIQSKPPVIKQAKPRDHEAEARKAASQPIAERGELKSKQLVEAAGAAKINRRSIMNMMVSAAALTATSAICDPASAKGDDGEVLSLASEILRLNELAHQDDDEMVRLQSIWYNEGIRLREEAEYSRDEQWEMVKAMPESAEHSRLVKKSDPYFESADRLMKRLWSLPAKTNKGKAAKVRVLFAYVLGEEWHRPDEEADPDIELTRQLLFELAGTSGAIETVATTPGAPDLFADNAESANTTPVDDSDPIFGLIEAHKTANAEYGAALKELVPGTHSPDPEKEMGFGDRERDACWELTTTVPKTLAGALAVLNYIKGVSNGEFSSNGHPDLAFDDDHLLNVLINTGDYLEAHLNMQNASGLA
jgi:hypothetical protein